MGRTSHMSLGTNDPFRKISFTIDSEGGISLFTYSFLQKSENVLLSTIVCSWGGFAVLFISTCIILKLYTKIVSLKSPKKACHIILVAWMVKMISDCVKNCYFPRKIITKILRANYWLYKFKFAQK